MLLEKITSLQNGTIDENVERLSLVLREHGADFVLYAKNLKLNGLYSGNCLFIDDNICDLLDMETERTIKGYLKIDKIVYTSGKGLI